MILGFEINCNTDDECELLEASPLPPRRIEVYGDSVSAGEVSEAIDYVAKADPEHNGEYSNSWYSYAWIAARKLDAQLHDIAQGGVALLDNTGWYHEPDYIGMEHVWNKMRYDSLYGQVTEWDFSKYTPDIVIVAIGQNDSHPDDYMKTDYEGEKAKNWRTHYRQFLAKLRETYPDAWIVCCTTLLQHDIGWDMSISQAVQDLGDKKVSHCVFKRNGKATPGHLRIPEAEEMAKELCHYIRTLGIRIRRLKLNGCRRIAWSSKVKIWSFQRTFCGEQRQVLIRLRDAIKMMEKATTSGISMSASQVISMKIRQVILPVTIFIDLRRMSQS